MGLVSREYHILEILPPVKFVILWEFDFTGLYIFRKKKKVFNVNIFYLLFNKIGYIK